MSIESRELHLKSRPVGMPKVQDFELVETHLPEPSTGEVLIQNIYMSVDPYMRGRMREGKIKYQETIIEGIEQASKAFIGLFSGDNEGKMLVKLAPE